jgi:putative tricarboxylic transport membrane protein
MTGKNPQGSEGDAGRGSASSLIHRTDLVLAVIILAICGGLYLATTTFAKVPASLAQNVQPTMFPRLLLAVIAFMALLLPFEHVQKKKQGIDLESGRRSPIKPIAFITALVLIGIVVITPWLGSLLAMIVACAVLPLLWGEGRYWLVATFAIVFPLAVTFLFVRGLEVNFLPGIVGHVFR